MNNKDLKRTLIKKIHGYQETQIIYTAARLRISDYLLDGDKSVDELSILTSAHKESLYRFLRACSSIGLYEEKEARFSLTEMGKLIASKNSGSLRSIALMRGEPVNWMPWSELYYGVKTGRSPFAKVFHINLFEYYDQNPESGENFNAGMRIFTDLDVKEICSAYDFSHFKTIVDVGGGNGHLLFSILENNPACQGILYDIPSVIDEAEQYKNISSAKNRIKIEPGNMFSTVPAGNDCYIVKKILHDWGDDDCITLLKNCRKSIQNHGKLLIVEFVIVEHKPTGKINDIHMMVVCPGGKERTEKEFSFLLEQSGFELNLIIELSGLSIIECIPV